MQLGRFWQIKWQIHGNGHENCKCANESEILKYTFEAVWAYTGKSNIQNLTQISKLKIKIKQSFGTDPH